MKPITITIGTRKSKLALWQANWVADNLKKEGIKVEMVPITTRGDKIQDVTIAKIGSKGVFTEELEHLLSEGTIDIAVHSAKDLQSTLPDQFEIIAYSVRENVQDVIVSRNPLSLDDEIVLGTSSTRRRALVGHYYPNVRLVDMRGNLQTRIDKMDKGDCDALVLAAAGVLRMQYGELIQHKLDPTKFVPPVGQGCIAIESHNRLAAEKRSLITKINNHPLTEKCLLAERSFLAAMEGGCSIPIFGLSKIEGDQVHLTGGIISLDGKEKIVGSASGNSPLEVGSKLAQNILNKGGKRLLNEIKNQLKNQ